MDELLDDFWDGFDEGEEETKVDDEEFELEDLDTPVEEDTFAGITFDDTPFSDFEEVTKEDSEIDAVRNTETEMVRPNLFDISSTINADNFDDYSMLAEDTLKFPYMVFEAQGSLNTVSGLCSGILTKGDVQVYFRPESDSLNKLIPVVKIATTPLNVRNLLRLAKKDTVYYRHAETEPERLAIPEQFIRFIDVNLKEDAEYWNNLIEEEKSPKTNTPEFILEDLYG